MAAIPSATEMIRPTSELTSSALKSLSRALIRSVMSSELMLTSASLFSLPGHDLPAQLLEPARDAGVQQPVPNLEHEPTKNGGVDTDLQADVLADPSGKVLGKAIAVSRGELDRSRGGGPDAPGCLIGQAHEFGGDLVSPINPMVGDQQAEQVQALRAQARQVELLDEGHPLLRGNAWVADDLPHLLVQKDLANEVQALRPVVQLLLVFGELEDGARVALSCCAHQPPPLESPRR